MNKINLQKKLQDLLDKGLDNITQLSEFKLSEKVRPNKWSKKEILGHLIDSGINNLQRFTEVQFEDTPYKIRSYKQNELVIANDYQNTSTKDLLQFWLVINNQISRVVTLQTEVSLDSKIETETEIIDLRFLITDYVNHLEHHLNQIIN